MQRPPIVVVLGHVDHGKTTLIDALRKSHLAAHEAGGITQSIGAYQVETKGKLVTIIDTPGHAAFAKMREHGAAVADIAILVIAADDGVQPQTLEAISHIKSAQVPYVVAINKIDVNGVDTVKVKTQLAEHDSAVEGFGGTVPVVEISAKQNKGLDELLEMVQLVADVSDIKGSPDDPLEAAVIETTKNSQYGILVSAVIRQGKVTPGDTIFSQTQTAKVKALINYLGHHTNSAGPGEPIQIMGFKNLVPVGTVITAKQIAVAQKIENTNEISQLTHKDDLLSNYILRADSEGALGALKSFVTDGKIISAAVGEISESDVLLAESTNSIIIGFRTKVPAATKALAKTHHVIILTNDIIYRLSEDLEVEKKKLESPPEIEMGRATIKKIFDYDGQIIAGCLVESGRLAKADKVHIVSGEEIQNGTIKHLKQGKTDVSEVKAKIECGVLVMPVNQEKLNLTAGSAIIPYRYELD